MPEPIPQTDHHTPWKLDDSGNPDDAGMIWDTSGRLIAETFVYNQKAGEDRQEELDLAAFIVTAVNAYDSQQAVVTAAEEHTRNLEYIRGMASSIRNGVQISSEGLRALDARIVKSFDTGKNYVAALAAVRGTQTEE